MRQRHSCRVSFDIYVWDFFNRHRSRAPAGWRATKQFDIWIVRVQLWVLLDLGGFWIRLVGIFALLQRLGYPGGVPFRVLDLLLCFEVWGHPRC